MSSISHYVPANQPTSQTPATVVSTAVNAPKTIEVICDICGESAENTRPNLLNSGWGIYSTQCFCPSHEEEF